MKTIKQIQSDIRDIKNAKREISSELCLDWLELTKAHSVLKQKAKAYDIAPPTYRIDRGPMYKAILSFELEHLKIIKFLEGEIHQIRMANAKMREAIIMSKLNLKVTEKDKLSSNKYSAIKNSPVHR